MRNGWMKLSKEKILNMLAEIDEMIMVADKMYENSKEWEKKVSEYDDYIHIWEQKGEEVRNSKRLTNLGDGVYKEELGEWRMSIGDILYTDSGEKVVTDIDYENDRFKSSRIGQEADADWDSLIGCKLVPSDDDYITKFKDDYHIVKHCGEDTPINAYFEHISDDIYKLK